MRIDTLTEMILVVSIGLCVHNHNYGLAAAAFAFLVRLA